MLIRLLVLLVGLLLAIPAMAEQAAIVQRLQGSAQAGARGLALGDPLFDGDTVTTGPQTRLEARFADGTILTLGEQAQLRIDGFLFQPTEQRGRLDLAVQQGAFLIRSGGMNALPNKPLRVITPVASIGIRGTTFWGGSLDNPLDVLVLDGRVYVESRAGRVEVDQGQGTDVKSGDQPPTPPSAWMPQKVQRAVDSITFSQ